MATPITPNMKNGDSLNWKAKAPAAIDQINADIAASVADKAIADGTPTNQQLIAIMQNLLAREQTDLVNLRKMINLLVNKL